jgi:hypothetical protein
MSRRVRLAGLLAALLPAVPAAAQGDAHRHEGFVFQIRYTPELNRDYLYKVYQPDPADPASLMVQRGAGYTGETRTVDLAAARCPALRRAVAALGALPVPAVQFEQYAYDIRAPRGEEYVFQGFARFANGAEGEVSFWAYDVPGRTPDAHLTRMRALVRAFDACLPPAG